MTQQGEQQTMSNTRKASTAVRPVAQSVAGFDVDSLTLGDLESLESYGVSLSELALIADLDVEKGQLPPAKVLTAVAWMMGKENNPDLTILECRDLTLDEMLDLISDAASTPLPDAVKN